VTGQSGTLINTVEDVRHGLLSGPCCESVVHIAAHDRDALASRAWARQLGFGMRVACTQGMKRHVKNSTQGAARWLATALAFGVTAATAAEPHQSAASIQAAAVAFVEAHADQFPVTPQVSAGQLDSRLRLGQCSEALQTFAPPGGLSAGRSVVGVRCDAEPRWKIFAPVDISLPAEVVAVARNIQRGELIHAQDIVVKTGDLARLRGQYFTDPAEVIGHRAKRNLAAAVVVTPAMIDARRLVKRGTEVTIVADAGAIEVRMTGKALAHGGRGDRIKVKNNRSGRVITATVVDRSLVRVND
jgi:flagella basal body P-ring formation protein FlgA